MRLLKKILNFVNSKRNNHIIRKYSLIHCSVVNRGIKMRCDNPLPDKVYLKINRDSIVSGEFIFESSTGQISIGCHSYIGGSRFISQNKI